jgi:hypothetical protein
MTIVGQFAIAKAIRQLQPSIVFFLKRKIKKTMVVLTRRKCFKEV